MKSGLLFSSILFMSAIAGLSAETRTFPATTRTTVSSSYQVSVDGQKVLTERFKDIHYAHFAADGRVEVVVRAMAPIQTWSISPKRADIRGRVDGHSLAFALTEPSQLVITINGGERLFVFADPVDATAPTLGAAGVVNVREFEVDPTGARTDTALLQKAIDVTAAAKKVLYFPPGIYRTGTLALKSNLTIYLAGGAMILGSPDRDDYPVDAGFKESDMKNDPQHWSNKGAQMTYSRLLLIDNAQHVRIAGRGVIDGQGEVIRGQGKPANLVRIRNSSDVVIDGVILRNPAAWNSHILHSDHVTYRNVKILNDREVKNTDGIDPDSAQDVLVDGCFFYCSDDTIAIKTSGNSRLLANAERITVRNCVFLTKKSAMKLGTETFAEFQRDITFEHNDVIEADRAMSLYSMDGAQFENIRFIGNRIESFYPDNQRTAIFFQVRNRDGQAPGRIENVLIKDTVIDVPSPQPGKMTGFDSTHGIRGVHFENYTIAGRRCRTAAEAQLDIGSHVTDVTFDGAAAIR